MLSTDYFLVLLVRLPLVLMLLSDVDDVWAALKIPDKSHEVKCYANFNTNLLDLDVWTSGVFSTTSSLESVAANFLLASLLGLGELVVELLAESGVFSLFLFLAVFWLLSLESEGVFCAFFLLSSLAPLSAPEDASSTFLPVL